MRELLEDLYILLQLVQYNFYINILQSNTMLTCILHNYKGVSTQLQTSFVEAGKGLFGITILHQNNNCIRCHFRSPAFLSLQVIKLMATGCYLSDLTALLGSLDIVFGEIDR